MNRTDSFVAMNNISHKDYEGIISHIDSIMRDLPGKTCATKSRRFETILLYYKYFPIFMDENYNLNPSAAKYEDRCIKRIAHLEKMWEYPQGDFCGLYLIGQCIFNPYTKEEFYLLKIGESSNVTKRLKQYKTYNPHMFLIDTYKTRKNRTAECLEGSCHRLLYQHHYNSYENTEWFLVDKNFYLEISTKGFSFFKENDNFFDTILVYDRS